MGFVLVGGILVANYLRRPLTDRRSNMPTFLINGLAGAGGGLVRCLYGFTMSDNPLPWSWKRMGGSILSGFIGGVALPEPITAAITGWAASEVIHKAARKIKAKQKLPENTI